MKNKFCLFFILVASIFSLSSCSTNKDYSDYSENEISTITEMYNQNDSVYYLYLYNDQCSHCETIKGDIFFYFDAFSNNYIHMYMFNMKKLGTEEGNKNRNYFKAKQESDSQSTLVDEMLNSDVSSVSDTYFFGTPSLYKIADGKLVGFAIGESDVKNALFDDFYACFGVCIGVIVLSGILVLLIFVIRKYRNKKVEIK